MCNNAVYIGYTLYGFDLDLKWPIWGIYNLLYSICCYLEVSLLNGNMIRSLEISLKRDSVICP
jgi:hypothetical protein